MKHHKSERQAWILEWFKANHSADSLNKEFHESYHAKFPEYAQAFKWWGANPVRQAMQDLKEMASDGLLEKFRIGLGANWQPGFPKSVFTYTLPKKSKP